MQKLSKRLKAIADLAGRGQCLADVGCDHGYLSIYLVEEGRFLRAVAMDVRTGPLQHAKEHIRQRHLEPYIETRLSDGLSALKKGEAQAVVLAGMGGVLMTRILAEGAFVLEPDTTLVLQPQSEVMEFRRYLAANGYAFLEEEMVKEDGKYYPMMRVKRKASPGSREVNCGRARAVYSDVELKYGPLLLGCRHPVLMEFLQQKYEKQTAIAEKIRRYAGVTAEKQMQRIEGELKELRQILWEEEIV